ncbi:MAG TPA: hypothetical protein VNJ53_07540 [Gaiellaceae bacterium]|nr:hypothetical protein [Gaiellaceae bacterium]
MTQALAATTGERTTTRTQAATTPWPQLSLDQRLDRKLALRQRYLGAVRFHEKRRALLATRRQGPDARTALRRARRLLARTNVAIGRLRVLIARREARRLAALPPRRAICAVFGRYCGQALRVAWCESRLATTARNGQYLGLFQMGSSERRRFGHGGTAYAQSRAAHRYFVRSGRDWSPWSCKPWY